MGEHIIKVRCRDGIWITGTIDSHVFGAKVCDEKSGFGIDGGRVIKLFVNCMYTGREAIGYERGWDKLPSSQEYCDILDAILLFCEGLPAQEIWRQALRKERFFLVTEDGVLEFE